MAIMIDYNYFTSKITHTNKRCFPDSYKNEDEHSIVRYNYYNNYLLL